MGNSVSSRSSPSASNFIAAPAEKSLEKLTRWPHRTSQSHCVQKPDTTALIVKKILKKLRKTHTHKRHSEPRGHKKQHLGREQGMTNSEGLDSKDEQFMLEQEPANKRTIREECGQSNWLKKLQSCLGQMTAAAPDMPCSEQLRTCSAYTQSLHIAPHSSVDVCIQESSERFTTFINSCSSGTRCS